MLSPLVVWRVEGITRDIIEACRKLPAIPWDEVEKHGGHHVLCLSKKKVDVFSKETRFVGAWVVDKKHSTLRIVFNLPEEYRKMGATF